ncbi:hypothetical protein BD780_000835 [Clostridium tetanomorphum]|uniref:Uncharacterized protein n=1 Tax=Clostridium tetanomorphum TaxID=1553 RepID=A0A923EBT4_CLOTT|nr:hypothetical protein [Clostridium tetanomorphum]MBC2398826.1 hypothetical protein [Clostridium tetanomorphum]MBP1863511.1 hypothetical protein [Clostridium tetanomorphum]NRS83610.1 hypothetical protein [Clostridium tetanomorphum]NRZ96806.1 hypothetical protein [Clostridium tetanomorphum]SQC01990.1 Uncharacterised protein [Clostridium tetanomorphum]
MKILLRSLLFFTNGRLLILPGGLKSESGLKLMIQMVCAVFSIENCIL